jgi:hypothetical protein
MHKLTRIRPGRPGFDSRQRQGLFSSLQNRAQTGSEAQSASHAMSTGSFLPEGKEAGVCRG